MCCGRTAREADGEVVWFRCLDAGVKFAEFHSAGDGDNKARSPGRSRGRPLKPLRAGMPGEPGEPRGDYARMLSISCIRGCGCIEHPAFPTPFAIRAVRYLHHSGAQASRECGDAFASLFEIPTRGGTAPQFPSSPGLTGRSSIPERLVTSREAAAYGIPAFAGMTRLRGGTTLSRGRRRWWVSAWDR